MAEDILRDPIIEGTEITMRLERILASGRTAFQQYAIAETRAYGTVLVLDGRLQSTQADDLVYHERLVHPALLSHPRPRRVFIGGGGEGATLREVLRHCTVEHARMVDIDEELVAACRRHLPSFHAGAFDDPRAEVVYGDARAGMGAPEPWDVIIFDITEPMEGSPAIPLFSAECFEEISSHLAPGGVFVLQAGSTALRSFPMFATVVRTLARVFPSVHPYHFLIQSFYEPWGFVLALKDAEAHIPIGNFEAEARFRIERELETLNAETYTSLFAFDPSRRAMLREDAAIITDGSLMALTTGEAGVSAHIGRATMATNRESGEDMQQ